MTGELLQPDSLDRMRRAWPVGDAVPGRPWRRHAYGLGLMTGLWSDETGEVVVAGHSGGGPGCVNAVFHFPGLPRPVTVACFAEGESESVVEWEALRLARLAQGPA
jgi:D-alanyl-D-alanine carboxypeptidase